MNKFVALLSFLFSSVLFGQVIAVVESWTTGYVDVNSYNGKTNDNLLVNFIKVQNSRGFNLSRWSMTVKVVGPITNGLTTFPPDKLKFRFNYLQGSGVGNGVSPTASNININTGLLPFKITDTYLVQQSPYSLNVENYLGINFYYDVVVEAGAYMTPHSSWENFRINLLVELRNAAGTVISTASPTFLMRIRPIDTPPQTPTYGIQFNADAKNVLLEFKTANDYANGVSKSLAKAFSTYSNTPYEVRVNTLTSNLSSITNRTLPANAVKLSVKDHQSGSVMGVVNLSTSQQNILTSNAHSTTKYFDTTYSTQAGDINFYNKSYEQYSGTVMFTMIPK